MKFQVTDDIPTIIEWYKKLFADENTIRQLYEKNERVIVCDFDNGDGGDDDTGAIEDSVVRDSSGMEFESLYKGIKVECSTQSDSTPIQWTMTLFELRELNKWFASTHVSSDSDVGATATIWNIFLCDLWDTANGASGDNGEKNVWISDSVGDGSIPVFGVYYQYSPSILSQKAKHKVYFSITAGSFFMHSISEEIHRPSNTVYLVGKLFPHWTTRNENGILECRIYDGEWMRAPSGFREKSRGMAEGTISDEPLYAYKSRWMTRTLADTSESPVELHVETTEVPTTSIPTTTIEPIEIEIENTPQQEDEPTKSPTISTTYKRRRKIHVVSEFVALWEWLRLWFYTYTLDEPLRLYKYNMRGERARIQYVFTKDECNELHTQLGYDGFMPFEWFSKIIVECMSIRWNRYTVFEEWCCDDSGIPYREQLIPCDTGSRVAYSTYKKARWVSRRIGSAVYRRIERGQIYPIRILFTGFTDDDGDASQTVNEDEMRQWIDAQKDTFVTVWVNKKGDEIAMTCVSPSSELIQWKKEFDYFLSQWFSVITK